MTRTQDRTDEEKRAMDRHWFADIDEEEGVPPYVWQPCLETGTGVIPSFDIWFESKERCEQWIRDNVIGVGLETE